MNKRIEPSAPDTAEPSPGRRAFLKGSLAAVAAPAVLTSRKSTAQVGAPVLFYPPSPPIQPWMEKLPTWYPVVQPVAALDPYPLEWANVGEGECGRADHQRYAELCVNPQFYELRVRENPNWVFNPAYPPQPVWGFQCSDGRVTSPGPTFFARYGRPVMTRVYNELPQDHTGFGTPEISTHLHNAHTPSESDGYPGDFFSPLKAGPTLGSPEGTAVPGQYKDHFWPNVYAGLDEFGGIGDPRESMGTLWYHDHAMDFTAPNVLKGLVGFYLLFDPLDSGNERDPNPDALHLPSYPYDYPIAFVDKRFDADGMLFYDQFNPEGVLGDRVCVNGKIKPVLKVARRKYRFRLLNGGPSRYYVFSLADRNFIQQPFTHIGNDGNLLPYALPDRYSVKLAVAERADIVVDFSKYPVGTVLFMVNRQLQGRTRGPRGVTGTGERVLKIVVNRDPPKPDLSQVPEVLRPLRPITQEEIDSAVVRRFEFNRSGGLWTINEKLFDVASPTVTPKQGQPEIWELVNMNDGWVHPVHIHFEEGRIIQKIVNGVEVPVPPEDQGRKDVYDLPEGPNSMLRVFIRFRDFHGKYVMHCHNLIHEDHAMMLRFDVEP